MISDILRETIQQLVIAGSFLFVVMVFLASIYEVRTSLIKRRMRDKRARRQHISIIVDGMGADEEAVTATMTTIAKNRYTKYDVVIVSGRRKGTPRYPRAKRYYASEQTSEAGRIQDAFRHSKQGEYLVTVPAGARPYRDALQEVNRAFYFHGRIRKLQLRSDSRDEISLRDSWSYLAGSMRGLWTRALAGLAIYRSGSLQIVALRSEDLGSGHRFEPTDIRPCVDAPSTRPNSAWVAAMYVSLSIFVIYDFFAASNKTQLIVAVVFVGAAAFIVSLIDSWSDRASRKLMLWYAPSALVVLLVAATSNLLGRNIATLR